MPQRTSNEVIGKLRDKIDRIEALKRQRRGSPDFKKWHRDTEVAIEWALGSEARHIGDFRAIRFSLSSYSSATPETAFQQAYTNGLDKAKAVLESFISEIEEYWDGSTPCTPSSAIDIVRKLCDRLHVVARAMQARHEDRATIEIGDEYDVQDLLHALLRIEFDDVRPEETTPSYAGGSSRMDFLLKAERIVVEVKMARKGLDAKKVGEELILDIAKYQSHPDCDQLFCFVYDPDGRIRNPRGLETDLSGKRDAIEVIVAVRPKEGQ